MRVAGRSHRRSRELSGGLAAAGCGRPTLPPTTRYSRHMPSFDEIGESAAPPELVWKLLYDPAQFERWWGCFEAGDAPQHDSHPRFPMPKVVGGDRGDGRITVSCMVSDIAFDWQL